MRREARASSHFILTIILLGLTVHLLIPQIATLEHSWLIVQSMTWWAVTTTSYSILLVAAGGWVGGAAAT
jgi:heme A synthase